MKIEKSKPRKGVSELPLMAKELTEKLQRCSDDELVEVLQGINVWRYGKCELYHWVDSLDRFDRILEDAATDADSDTDQCIFMCPRLKNPQFKEKVVTILNFTSLLIEHSYARHIYNSTEHLFVLLGCPDLDVVLAVLNLFYVFSKRSNFISRLSAKKRSSLNAYLEYLGETWGGKQSGFGLAECCRDIDIKLFPVTSTSVSFKYQPEKQDGQALMPCETVFLEKLHESSETVTDVLSKVTASHKIPLQQQMQLLTRVRLAKNFPNFGQRCKCILARLQALSILVYSVGPAEVVDPLIYEGFVEELVEVLESKEPRLMEIKAAVLRTLTAIIHLERDPKLAAIVESTGAGAYHGFLPTLVRGSVASFTSQKPSNDEFPLLFNTALFSFLYHLATYETSGDALVTSGIMESLLQVLEWKANEPMNITLVTRAVRVIDLVTGLDMSAFHSLGGWEKMLSRLEIEVDMCREEAPVILPAELKPAITTHEQDPTGGDESSLMEVDSTLELEEGLVSCMPERAALIKSILNFLKKAIPEPTFAENIRNFVDTSLPRSLKHIVSNAEYYGPSIYLPATEVTTVFIFQEPSQLSPLQDNGLPGVVINSIITKPIPATREVLSSLPNILSAMCLNTRGLESFIAAEPFDHLFSVLTSPDYLPAMRKKKGADQAGDTATSLGVAMDELMRHQPALRISVISALIRLLKSLVVMGSMSGGRRRTDGRKVSTVDLLSDDHMSADSDDDYDDESEPGDTRDTAGTDSSPEALTEDSDKSTQLLTEYVLNVIHFVDAILTNNTTKDHVTEFIKQGGLQPLVQLFALPLLPLDFPSMHGFSALSSACRGILNLAKPADLLTESLNQLSTVLTSLAPFINSCQSSSSVLLDEVGSLSNVPEAIKTPLGSPQLHKLAIANTFMQHFIYIFRTCGPHYNLETREVVLAKFASELGKSVLEQLSKLYKALVWEGFILLAVAADEEKKKQSKEVEKMETEPAVSDEQVVSKLSPLGSEQPWLMVDSLKHLTPLLTLTSRVGRSLAEFMNLLVRISITPLVRNPHRSRFRDDSYVPPSEDAMKICEEVTCLLVESLQWEVPFPTASEQAMSSPIKDWLFAGMTFKMYAVDFCELLLFDEHKQVYHMVLHAFDRQSGLDSYTSSFNEALRVINEEDDSTSIYGSSVDFLEAWLNLAEKLLNTLAIISSTHSLAIPPPEQTNNKRLIYHPIFNPLGFLVQAQKAILPCLKALWDSPRMPKLTLKVIELLLATLRHLYLSEKPMERKLDEYIAADNREDRASQNARIRAEMEAVGRASRDRQEQQQVVSRSERSVEPPPPPRVDPLHLQQLCDMGFARPHAEEALVACANDLNTAMEWILTHPMTETPSAEPLSEEEALSRAIALSLEKSEEQTDAEKEESLKKEEKEERERREAEEKAKEYNALKGMDKSVLEDFSNVLLPGSVELAAAVPECVSRVCDLIVSMAKRNGEEWWQRGAQRVKNTVKQCVDDMASCVAAGGYVKPKNSMEPLACQLQLLAMIMEEMPVSCARTVCEPEFLKSCFHLLNVSQANMESLCCVDPSKRLDKLPPSPKWLTALLTLIDIWGKTIRIARWWRPPREDCVVIWQWFENSRWCSYSQDLGNSLEKAYQNGNYCYSVKSPGRSRYENYRNIVMFDPMLQVNTETGTIRPVVRLEVLKSAGKQKSKEVVQQHKPASPYELKISEDGSCAPSNITEAQSHSCLRHCVRLLSSPIDSDTLNATLRLCLRFTRTSSGAVVFTNCGGPQAILSLNSKSGFKGFSALAINILRHCIEDKETMKRTMEHIVQSTLTVPSSIVKEVKPQGNGLKDYHYVLRRLAPIATRDEELLADICVRILRVTSKVPKPDTYFTQRPTPTFLTSVGPHRIPEAPLLPAHKTLINMLIEHLCSDPLIAEAQFVGESGEGRVEDSSLDAKLVFPANRNRTLYRRQARSGRYEEDDDDATVDGEESQPSRQNSDATTDSSSPIDDPKPLVEHSTERPLLSMAATLKLLAEIVDSYPQCGMLIVDSTCSVKVNGPSPKEMSLLAFIFDYIIPCASHSNTKIQNISKLAKSFIQCIATANYKPDIITVLVIEFKTAFLRALSLPESQNKHNRIRALTGLLALVTDYNVLVTRGPVNPGQFARILIRKGLISDMTRALHSLDLTSPLLPVTLNGILKPLEALTRIVNQVSTTTDQKKKEMLRMNLEIPEAISEPATVPTSNQALTRTVAASSPAVLASDTGSPALGGSEQTPGAPDILDATHESLVPLEEEEPTEGEPGSIEEDIPMDREQILDTVASLASTIGRAHAQRQLDEDEGEADESGDMDQSGDIEDADDIEADSDSDSEDPEMLEDGCNSAGEEVEDEEFDESQLDSSHSVEDESDVGDSGHGEDTEVEDESSSEAESIEEQSEEQEQDEEGPPSYDGESLPSSPELGVPNAHEQESDLEPEDVLDLEYDFEDDITEEMDYFIDMPWARGGLTEGEVTLVPDGRLAGGGSYTRSLHARPGQHSSADLDQTNSFSGQTIPIHHPLMIRTADHSSQLAQRVRSGSHIPYETPVPIGADSSHSSAQPESAIHQLLANISVATGSSEGVSYGVGASGAQRIKQSSTSQEQALEEELESSVIQTAMNRWEETSSIIDGPATVHCMHQLRDVIKSQWAELYTKENPKETSEEEAFPGRRRNRGTVTVPGTGAPTGVSTGSASVTTASLGATHTTAPSILSVAPNTSDQATPSSPRDPPTTVDQLQSSLRQVADALAQTVEAVRSTREQLTNDEELTEATSTPGPSTTTAGDTPNTTTTPSSSAHPIMATFDGTQESAVASLAATNRDDPLYMFLSAVAGAPTPPHTTQTPSTAPGVDTPRLPVFAQMQQEQISEPAETEQSAIRTPVIQDARPLGSQSLSLTDVQRMEDSQEPADTEETEATTESISLAGQLAVASSTPPSNSQSLQSPSPSDTLAPLLISSLQLPTTASEGLSSSVIHDHPNMTPSQPSQASNTSPQALASSVPGDMLTPTGPQQSVASSSSTQEPSASQSTGETPESSIDPTFLAALPLSIRQEVLMQHRREQRSRQPAESQEGGTLFHSTISPEFLAALPPNIQTEVIQQERLDRSRQQGTTNPAEPLDNSSFFQNLPSDLRRAILSDLDDGSLGHLPDELANEARRLQQERESRRRQIQAQRDAFLERMMEEAQMRAEASGAGGAANVVGGMPHHQFSHHSFEAAGLHYAIVNLNPYALINMPTYRPDRRALAAQAAAKGEPSSKQMLDPESLACILVPLFLDHNRLHINRLHRIIKNLCQHGETRGWVLSSLLEIIRKLQVPSLSATCPMPPPLTDGQSLTCSTPNWLNISMSAALGASAQVFRVEHHGKGSVSPNIIIHPLASTSICHHVLELLVFLARQFQSGFLPHDLLPSKNPEAPSVVSRFWNIILKLDSITSKKGKTGMKTFEFALSRETYSEIELFESSILGQLISLFSQEVFKDNISLTDKLLRVLSYASSAIPKTGLSRKKPITEPPSSEASLDPGLSKEEALGMISPHLIKIVVSVLISGRCSEDGLEDATSLLTNLSKCSIKTRESILIILLEGVKTIGQTLTSQVSALFDNLVENMESLVGKRRNSDSVAHSSKEATLTSGIVLPSVSAPEKRTDHSNDLHLPSMVPLTCKGSQQSFFLRMLKVVCQLRESAQSAIATQNKASASTSTEEGSSQKPMDTDQSSSSTGSSQKFMLQPLSLQLELEELWSMLSDSLDALGRTKDSHAVLVLQPLVEAFFLVHADSNDDLKQTKKRGSSLINRSGRLASFHTLSDTDVPDSPAPAPMDSISPAPGTPRADSEVDLYAHLPPDIARFLKFAEKHRTVLNQILRQSTLPLSEGPFSVLVHHTKVLDFDIKRRYFRHELEQTDDGMRRDDIVVHIRRDHIFEDSFRELYRRSAEELKGNLYIQFDGEEGQDVGGLLREWYLIIAREMFNPNYALFQLTPGDRVTYIPNPLSHVNPNHLNYFKFTGRVIAKAIYDNKLLDCYFTRSFYKHILGKPVHFSDIEAEDYAFYQGIVYLLEHNYDELEMDLNFTVEVQEFGKTEVKDLKPDGKNIVVTEANKREYVQLACQMKMTGSIQAQIKSFLEGFYEVIPKNLIAIFNEQELELLISGLPNIDIDDLKANTEYHKYTESSLQIQWFWRALRSFDQADRARFLQFVTGTSKVPLQGFAALEGMNGLQKFQIHKDDRSTDRLPCAHTCFNQLDLPPYPTYDKLYEMLLLAVTECPEGFGLA